MNTQLVIWKYFILTIAVELPVAGLWLRSEWKQAIVISFWLNLFTWPLLVVLVTNLHWNVLMLEAAVVVVEGCGYQGFFRRGWITSMGLSMVANGLSYALGLLI